MNNGKPHVGITIHCIEGLSFTHRDLEGKEEGTEPFTIATIAGNPNNPAILIPFGARIIVQQTANVETPA